MLRKALPLALSLIIITLTSLTVAAPVALGSDSPATWSKTYGGPGSDRASAMIRTHEGGYAMIGTTNSYGSGLVSAWLVKTDVDGNILWNQSYSGLGQGIADTLVQASDNGYAATGYTYSLDQSTGEGALSMWILRTDYLGNLLWNNTYSQVGTSIGYSIIQTSDGGFAVAGTSNSIGDVAWAAWILKVDSNGVLQWYKVFTPTNRNEVYSMLQTADGGYIMGGSVLSSDSTQTNFWLLRTDSSGEEQWNQTYSMSGNSTLGSVVQTSDGGYALSGALQGSAAGDQFLLVKTDSSGIMQWYKTYNPVGSDSAYSGIQTSDGGYALIGASGLAGNPFYRVLLVKTTLDGSLQWNQTYGGNAVAVAGAIVQIPDGSYVFGGYTNSTGAGSEDFWLVKTDSNGNIALPSSSSTPTPFNPSVSPTTTNDASSGNGSTWNFTTTLIVGVTILAVVIAAGILMLRRQSSKNRYKKPR